MCRISGGCRIQCEVTTSLISKCVGLAEAGGLQEADRRETWMEDHGKRADATQDQRQKTQISRGGNLGQEIVLCTTGNSIQYNRKNQCVQQEIVLCTTEDSIL